jgi:hypothetical protein
MSVSQCRLIKGEIKGEIFQTPFDYLPDFVIQAGAQGDCQTERSRSLFYKKKNDSIL